GARTRGGRDDPSEPLARARPAWGRGTPQRPAPGAQPGCRGHPPELILLVVHVSAERADRALEPGLQLLAARLPPVQPAPGEVHALRADAGACDHPALVLEAACLADDPLQDVDPGFIRHAAVREHRAELVLDQVVVAALGVAARHLLPRPGIDCSTL